MNRDILSINKRGIYEVKTDNMVVINLYRLVYDVQVVNNNEYRLNMEQVGWVLNRAAPERCTWETLNMAWGLYVLGELDDESVRRYLESADGLLTLGRHGVVAEYVKGCMLRMGIPPSWGLMEREEEDRTGWQLDRQKKRMPVRASQDVVWEMLRQGDAEVKDGVLQEAQRFYNEGNRLYEHVQALGEKYGKATQEGLRERKVLQQAKEDVEESKRLVEAANKLLQAKDEEIGRLREEAEAKEAEIGRLREELREERSAENRRRWELEGVRKLFRWFLARMRRWGEARREREYDRLEVFLKYADMPEDVAEMVESLQEPLEERRGGGNTIILQGNAEIQEIHDNGTVNVKMGD